MPTHNPVRFLIVDGGSEDPTKNYQLRKNIKEMEGAARYAGAEVEILRLADYPLVVGDPIRSVEDIPQEYEKMIHLVRLADILTLSSDVHWMSECLRMKAFGDTILAPLEESGYKCWGKVGATFLVCNDDGAAMAASKLVTMMIHMGFVVPPWACHHTNVSIEPGKTEDDWQRKPGLVAPILVETALRMRGFPTPQDFEGMYEEFKTLA